MMFENGYVQQKIRPAYNRARIECRGRKPFIHESRFEAVSHPMDFVRSDYLKGIDDQVRGIAIHQIPAIGLTLVAPRCRNACRAYPADLFVTSDIDPPQLVEPDEMIHFNMGHDNVSYNPQVPRPGRSAIPPHQPTAPTPVGD